MNYIGVDLAWTVKNKTGFCIINENKHVTLLDAKVYSNDELVELITTNLPSITSVDAPLVIKNETGGRKCDSALMKTRINGSYLKLYATSRKYMLSTFSTIRGEDIYRSLHDNHNFTLGNDIIETFPTGIYLSLFPNLFSHKYKISSRLSLEELLTNADLLISAIKKLGFTGININLSKVATKSKYKDYEDQLDGLLCAVNSYYLHRKESLIFRVDDNGIISLPYVVT